MVLYFSFCRRRRSAGQVDLKFKRLQYIAYETGVATVAITNLADAILNFTTRPGNPGWLEITQ